MFTITTSNFFIFWRALDDLGNSMRGFERRNNSFGSSQQHGRLQRFGVTGGDVFGSAGVVEFGVLGPIDG